ncbi:MAG TPA: CaiB/BaiF CoA-transferase family protein [Nitrososphaerales archaeon]|nr:CaiB/BaiF CoA-transferase family protein [Nitrososphaerales archaeon]
MGFLDGVRVVDVTRLLPGGYCSMLLSDLGAEVIKVEQPGIGDYMRATPPTKGGKSPVHATANRNKRSIGIDLTKEDGRLILGKLVKSADVFLEGYRPGVIERLGFSYANVRALNPKITYCSISAFGQKSKYSRIPGHDINFQALAGALAYPRRPSVPMIQLSDFSSGTFAALAIVASLARKEREATFIDVPIVPSLFSWMMLPVSAYQATGKLPSEGHSLILGSDSYYNLFKTKDGKYMAVAAIEQEFWENLVAAMGLPELREKRFGARVERRDVIRRLRLAFATKTRDEWTKILMFAETCATPVLTIEEALGTDWAHDARILVDVPGDGTVVNNPIVSVPRIRSSSYTPAPDLGEHTPDIMAELGYSKAEIRRLRAASVIQ